MGWRVEGLKISHLRKLVLTASTLALMVIALVVQPFNVSSESEDPVIGGVWTVETGISPEVITTGDTAGAELSVVATFRVDAAEAENVTSLSAIRTSPGGGLIGEFPILDPQSVGFGLSADGEFERRYSITVPSQPVCDAELNSDETISGVLRCVFRFSEPEGVLIYAKPEASDGDYTMVAGTPVPFTLTAVVNGVNSSVHEVRFGIFDLGFKVV